MTSEKELLSNLSDLSDPDSDALEIDLSPSDEAIEDLPDDIPGSSETPADEKASSSGPRVASSKF